MGAALVRAEVLEVRMPLKEPFVTGFGSTDTRRTVLVHVVDADGAEGWGEAAALDHPFYLPDTTSGTFAVVAEWALPLALAGEPDPRAAAERLAAVRGNTFAKAGVEAALWCLEAVRRGTSLAAVFAAEAGGVPTRARIPAGESVGIHPSLPDTLETVDRALAKGYRRIKLKVKPGWDEEVVAAVRDHIGPGIMLQVDANGSYRLGSGDQRDASALTALDGLGLACIEQPLPPSDLPALATLAARLETPVCLDESLTGLRRLADALRYGACEAACCKPARLGGLLAARRAQDRCRAAGVPAFVGGLFETGLARAANAALAALPGFTWPGDLTDPSGYLDADPFTHPGSVGGRVPLTSTPGLGSVPRPDRLAAATVESVWRQAGGGRPRRSPVPPGRRSHPVAGPTRSGPGPPGARGLWAPTIVGPCSASSSSGASVRSTHGWCAPARSWRCSTSSSPWWRRTRRPAASAPSSRRRRSPPTSTPRRGGTPTPWRAPAMPCARRSTSSSTARTSC